MQRAILISAALLIPASVMAADLQPGKYRIATKIEGMKEADKADDHCITQKDIDSGLTKLGVEQEDTSCRISDFKRAPGSVSYRSTCKDGGATDVKGTLGSDRFELQLLVRMNKNDPATKIIASGKRLGAC